MLTMRVTARAEDSQYQRIVALVAEAAESKAPFVRMADRYAVPFTIAAYVLAALGWIWSGEPARFAEVLVVATPCPLIIATPVAFIAGMSRQARHGIIVKNGGTLEKLARIRTAAFDKTGTLTHGQPALASLHPSTGWNKNDLLAIAASAEQYSAHTLAQSIVTSTRFLGLDISPATDVVETTAHGLTARVGGRVVVVGKFGFISDVDAGTTKQKLEPGEVGVYVAVDGTYAGAIILRDEIRSDAAETISWLRRMGVTQAVMLTGDAKATAQHVADQLGVTEVDADCLPLDKVHRVQALTHRPVMMVGDGVNDAPVLAAADVGVAMGARGSTAASESADVVIMKDDLSRVARAVEISKQTIRIATQSIWIGMVLSVGLMVVAVFGLLPAILGATLQEIIDLVTILNALRALGGKANVVRLVAQVTTVPPTTSTPA
jgi:heavy metal translocating P-type ATPase